MDTVDIRQPIWLSVQPQTHLSRSIQFPCAGSQQWHHLTSLDITWKVKSFGVSTHL